jgi:hypothetical protein
LLVIEEQMARGLVALGGGEGGEALEVGERDDNINASSEFLPGGHGLVGDADGRWFTHGRPPGWNGST